MNRKRVFLVGPPFSGHLHPLLGISRRLQATSEVRVVSTPDGVASAKACGIDGKEILVAEERQIWDIAEPGGAVKNNPLRMWRQLKTNVALMGQMKRELDTLIAAEKPDLVIADFTVPVAGLSAMAHGVPWWTTLPSPCVYESPDGPPAYFGGQIPAKTKVAELRHAVLRRITRWFKQSMWLLFRKEFRALGFHGIYRRDGTEAVYSPERIFALGLPEIEFARTYPPHFQIVGPVLFTPPYSGPTPVFSNDGRPHVLITIGTHLPHAKRGLLETIRQIAERHKEIVFHFTHGDGSAATEAPCAGNLHEYQYVSYADHLSRYDLVVHHAGAGILHHCLSHGKPSVVHPLDYDQFDYAARLVEAGLAIAAPGNEDIGAAIIRALGDSELKAKCAAMQSVCARYDAAGTIADLVNRMPTTGAH